MIKTMCLRKINHIVAEVPDPNLMHLQQLDAEFKSFISDNNPNIVDETTRHMTRQEGGLGLPNINNFWRALRLTWFKRGIDSNSTWAGLHYHETFPHAFNPVSSNFVSLNKAILCRTICIANYMQN